MMPIDLLLCIGFIVIVFGGFFGSLLVSDGDGKPGFTLLSVAVLYLVVATSWAFVSSAYPWTVDREIPCVVYSMDDSQYVRWVDSDNTEVVANINKIMGRKFCDEDTVMVRVYDLNYCGLLYSRDPLYYHPSDEPTLAPEI